MQKSSIEWINPVPGVGYTWNPTSGCSIVNKDCTRCYAMRQAARFAGEGQPFHGLVRRTKDGPIWTGKVRLEEDRVMQPLRRRVPSMFFVDSMSDLMHKALTDEQIDQPFAAMLLSPWHRYVFLTKRHERLAEYTTSPELYQRVLGAADAMRQAMPRLMTVGISNPAALPAGWIWGGISAGYQEALDERIVGLLRASLAVRVLSLEPLIGPVTLWKWLRPHHHVWSAHAVRGCAACTLRQDHDIDHNASISWVITGAESGPGRRPCELGWIRDLRDECALGNVPFFFKQWVDGEGKHGLPKLDGKTWAMWPRSHATWPW